MSKGKDYWDNFNANIHKDLDNASRMARERLNQIRSMSAESKRKHDIHHKYQVKHQNDAVMNYLKRGQQKKVHQARIKENYHLMMRDFYIRNNRAPTDNEKKKIWNDSVKHINERRWNW